MEEKNLIKLPDKVADYLEFMKEKGYTLKGALNVVIGQDETKIFMNKYFGDSTNQEKFALAWVNGYKVEEKKFLVKFKNLGNIYGYLNYDREEKIFKLSSKDESKYFQTKFTKKFLEENYFGWLFNCDGVELIEVEND